uniref:Uncharacterized protein n=1 Tax=Arundo donax TaxID=35708 RepID=A0A0A9ER54_ARUDO
MALFGADCAHNPLLGIRFLENPFVTAYVESSRIRNQKLFQTGPINLQVTPRNNRRLELNYELHNS